MTHTKLSRRDFLKAGGALVIGVMVPGAVHAVFGQAAAVGGKPPLTPDELDSWIAVLPDGSVRAFFGKMDMGQGVDVAIGQIVADELDVAFERVNVVMGDTAFTCNQGGASGSTAIQNGGVTLRYAAAEARRVLVERAAQKLGVPAEKLTVQDGVVSMAGAPERKVTYGDLIGGQYFQLTLEWNKRYGNPLLAKGQAIPKKPSEYKLVGQSIPQRVVADKVYGRQQYVTTSKSTACSMRACCGRRRPAAGRSLSTSHRSAAFPVRAWFARRSSWPWWLNGSGTRCAQPGR
jgi:nicotinate dehydrogenase subunit B